jgi:pre-mRNA-processing factor 8
MSAYDVNLHSRLLNNNTNWDPEKSIVITSSFTPGSCTLSAYKLTRQGFEWGKKNEELMV